MSLNSLDAQRSAAIRSETPEQRAAHIRGVLGTIRGRESAGMDVPELHSATLAALRRQLRTDELTLRMLGQSVTFARWQWEALRDCLRPDDREDLHRRVSNLLDAHANGEVWAEGSDAE